MLQGLQPGLRVAVRGETWRIVGVTPWTDCTELRLVGAAASNDAEERTLLGPFDRFEPAEIDQRPMRASRRKWMAALAAGLGTTRPVDGLQAAHRADIDLLPWQLEPALALVSGKSSRILVADGVGLGKTVQALVALVELSIRGEAGRVLIVTPAGLRDQWAAELAGRFNRPCSFVDAAFLLSTVRDLPPGVNPWSLPGIYLVSFDFLKRREVLRGVEGLCWDLLIADEAHLAAPATDRLAALASAGARAARVILLTATPYTSGQEGYDALCRVGRLGSTDDLLVFRRTRAVADPVVRGPGPTLPMRRTRIIRVALRSDERRLHRLLRRYTSLVWRETPDGAARLAMMVLRKRALSGAWPLGRTIERRLALLAARRDYSGLDSAQGKQNRLPFEPEDESETSPEDCVPDAIVGVPGLLNASAELGALTAIREAAAGVTRAGESKTRVLARLLARTPEPAIVFTEYRDTLEHLVTVLGRVRACAVLHGGLSRADRTAASSALDRGAVTLLLATDAASEGLNLHRRCRWVINFELPWNPARLEQRAGRVDRYGQQRTPHVVHLIARDTAESLVLARLEVRIRRAQQAGWLAAVWPTEPQVAAAIIGGERLPLPRAAGTASDKSGPLTSRPWFQPNDEDEAKTSYDSESLSRLARRACDDATVRRQLWKRRKSEHAGRVLVLEVSRSRLARQRSGLDRLLAKSRGLRILELAIRDGAGRVVDSTVVAALGTSEPVAAGAAAASGLQRLNYVHEFRSLAITRSLARWRAIAEMCWSARPKAVQPALFDSRALDAAEAAAALRHALEVELRSRMDRLERSRNVQIEPPRLMLVANEADRS